MAQRSAFCWLSVGLLLAGLFAQFATFILVAYGQDEARALERVGFRYLIYDNELFNEGAGPRNVYVFLDEKAFSEDNLRKLFGVLSNFYQKPKVLSVIVITSLEQVGDLPFPPGASGGQEPEGSRKHHRAIYVRFEDEEFFRYTISPPRDDLKTVVIRKRPDR